MKFSIAIVRIWIVLLAVALLSISVQAQKLEKGAAPISLESSGWVLLGGEAELRGVSVPLGNKQVKLDITDPKGKSKRITALVNGNGSFSTKFTETGLVGMYFVKGTAPDNKGKAETSFIVSGPVDMSSHAVFGTRLLLATMITGIPKLENQIKVLPPSPAREEAVQRFESIRASLEEAVTRAGQLQSDLAAVDSIVLKSPAFSEALEPAYMDMNELNQGVDIAQERLEEKLAIWGNKKPTACDDLDTAAAGLDMYAGFVTFMTNKWYQIAIDISEKTVMDKLKLIPNANVSSSDVMFAKSVLKTAEKGLTEGWKKCLDDSKGLIISAVDWGMGKFFGLYCVHYKGSYKAHIGVQYFAGNKKWWAYNIDLNGKLTLRYEKTDGGDPTQVTGEFEGNAGNFRLMEDLLVATPYMKRFVIFRLALPPPPPPTGQAEIADAFGKVGRTFAGPYSFLIPVHGIIDGDDLILEIDPATKDYGDLVKGRCWYIMVNPQSPVPIPYIMKTDLPMVKAFFILSRGTHGKPSFKIKVNGDKSEINRTFTREEVDPKGGYKVVWKVDIRACNPACN